VHNGLLVVFGMAEEVGIGEELGEAVGGLIMAVHGVVDGVTKGR